VEIGTIDRIPASYAEAPLHEPAADIVRIFGVVRRQYWLALAGGAVAVLLAIGFLSITTPSYLSSIRILLDQDRNKLVSGLTDDQKLTSTEEYIATQIALISSDFVARRVAHDLGLTYDREEKRLRLGQNSADMKSGRLSRISGEELAALDTDPAVVGAILKSVSVYQVEKSLVIQIDAADPDPQLAQVLANAYGRAYLTDQLSARFEATRKAGSWLEDRINTLRDQSLEASAAVEQFRKDNNLVSTDGRLLSDQQLGIVNDQLTAARLATTRATVKVSSLQDTIEKRDVDAIISLAGSSPEFADTSPIAKLRADYLQALGRTADVAARWGADNEQAKALQAEVDRLSGQIIEEARRILSGYQRDLDVAQSEFEALRTAASQATGQSQADNSTLVALRAMEQRAASYNALYQDYLARYQEAVQQQTLALTTGRVISKPELPSLPIFPNQKVILALSLVLGMGVGGGLGLAREVMNRRFRGRSDVERKGMGFLGYVTAFDNGAATNKRATSTPAQDLLADHRQFGRWRMATSRVAMAIDIRHSGKSKTIGMISVEASLSRSVLALAFATEEARAGRRVLLIDADFESATLTKALAPMATNSIVDVLYGRQTLEEACLLVEGGVVLLPASNDADMAPSVNFNLADQLKLWRPLFDDLPPAGPISVARAIAPSIDGFVGTVAWNRTPRHAVDELMESSRSFAGKLVGIVITDVKRKKLRLYDPASDGLTSPSGSIVAAKRIKKAA
jgi:succinoglycan biosynthesis transport protein ExoP